MPDTMTSSQRHYCMSRIRGKDTRPEMYVRLYLHKRGFRYSLHSKKLPGKPDIVLRKYHTVIFVNGCFWHGHPGCESVRMPKTNSEYWAEKIRRNKERDAQDIALLQAAGWFSLVVWECELSRSKREDTLAKIERRLKQTLEVSELTHIPPSVRRISLEDSSE